ncbi:MAG: twin-arginine translocation signal domain-containing protein [Chloroflexi bacterium]|nr:twin-arginine translocation signal domain-containing protein [Chloroflexota bacterium]MBK9750660.1 twin-arginine translocation signal domain-containing protein [Chloroflexota bacterium]
MPAAITSAITAKTAVSRRKLVTGGAAAVCLAFIGQRHPQPPV